MFHSVICSPSTFCAKSVWAHVKILHSKHVDARHTPSKHVPGRQLSLFSNNIGLRRDSHILNCRFLKKNQIGLLLNHQFLTTPRVMPLAAKLNYGFTHRSLTCFCSKTGLNPWEMLLQHLVSVDEECIYIHIHLIHCSLLSHVQQS